MKSVKLMPFLIFLMLVILPLTMVSAQDEPIDQDKLVSAIASGTEAMIISSPTNETDYLIFVHLPRSYHTNTNLTYPVLYLLDANFTFGTVTEQTKYLPYASELPEIIVVGIGYPAMLDLGTSKHSEAQNEIWDRREQDLAPDQKPDLFLEFLTDTLIPYIDVTYRTDPNDRAIMGHSYGGDFVLYTFFHASGIFQRFVASSPGSVCIKCELEDKPELSGIIFLSAGESDGNSPMYVDATFRLLQEQANTNLNLLVSAERFEGTTHMTVTPFALTRGLTNVYCGTNLESTRNCNIPLSVQHINSIEDMDFPSGKNFVTPDKPIILKSDPARYATSVGYCQNMNVTVLQAAEYPNGPVWIQLECGDITGWFPKNLLDG